MSREQAKSNNEKRQFWQMAIETWQSSGMSISKFCKAEGLAEGTFYNWRNKLTDGRTQTNKQAVKKQSAFIKVAIPRSDRAFLELELSSGNTLRIRSGTDSKTLSDVLSVLHRQGLC
ncbi:transposase [Planctomycetota bacterium]